MMLPRHNSNMFVNFSFPTNKQSEFAAECSRAGRMKIEKWSLFSRLPASYPKDATLNVFIFFNISFCP
jgi:hypothetical protein